MTVSVADFLLANEVLYWRITYWPSGAPGRTRGVLLGFELPGFHFAQRLPRCASALTKSRLSTAFLKKSAAVSQLREYCP